MTIGYIEYNYWIIYPDITVTRGTAMQSTAGSALQSLMSSRLGSGGWVIRISRGMEDQ